MKTAVKTSSAILVVTALTVALTIGGPTSRARATVPRASLTPASFTNDFSAMATLKPLAKKGKGNVAVLLPDTQSSARYVSFDAPYLTQAFQAAGLSSDQFQVQNAQGSTQTMQTQAEAAITNGATVLVIDPLDSGSGAAIEANAVQQGVKVIDYDRLTLNGKASYYVSFNNVTVGKLLGKGLVDCVASWNVAKPQVLEMDGDPTDNNATQFAQGYNSVLNPKYKSKAFVKVGEPAGTWDSAKALTNFEQQFTAHPNINAVLAANDGVGNSVISVTQEQPGSGEEGADDGSGRHAGGSAEHPVRLPVHDGVQARLHRGPGRGGRGDVPAGGAEAAVEPRERQDQQQGDQRAVRAT